MCGQSVYVFTNCDVCDPVGVHCTVPSGRKMNPLILEMLDINDLISDIVQTRNQ